MNENGNAAALDLENGSVDGASATEAETEKKTERFTQADVDRRVQEALKTARSKWDGELNGKLEEAKNEGARLAKLSAEERQKEEARAEREQLEREKAEFAHKSLVAEAVKQLGERGLPVELAKMAAGDNAEAAQENIKTLETAWDKAVENAVSKRLSSKAPNIGTSEVNGAGNGFFEIIKQNQRI